MIKDSLQSISSELPSGVKLVAVSKFHPTSCIEEAIQAGQKCFGESRPQEFMQKVKELDDSGVEWHFIGHLQTNKLKMVLPFASLVQSIDSLHLLEAVEKWGAENSSKVNVLIEVHIGSEETKSGFSPSQVMDLISKSGTYPNVRFCGLMGMATNTDDKERIRADFAVIRKLFDDVKEKFPEMNDFRELSIGMSDDWKIALEFNPTIVRIGTAIFGSRQY